MLHTNTFGAGVVVAADVFFSVVLLILVAFKYIQMTLKIFNPENSIGVLKLNIYHRLHTRRNVEQQQHTEFAPFLLFKEAPIYNRHTQTLGVKCLN